MKKLALVLLTACSTAPAASDVDARPTSDSRPIDSPATAQQIVCNLLNTTKLTWPNGAWVSTTIHFAWVDGVSNGDRLVMEQCGYTVTTTPPPAPCTTGCPTSTTTGDSVPANGPEVCHQGGGTYAVFYSGKLYIECSRETTGASTAGPPTTATTQTSTIRIYR